MSVGNQVEKPRFFIDLLQYQYEIGNIGCITTEDPNEGSVYPNLIGLNPTRKFESVSTASDAYLSLWIGFKNPISIPSKNV